MRNSTNTDSLLNDVINQSKSIYLSKQLIYTEEFVNLKNSLENFINGSHDISDFDNTGLFLIIVNHPFWENIMLNGNIYQKEYLDYFLNFALDLTNYIKKKGYYRTKVIKSSHEWGNFIYEPNLSNLSILTRVIYKLIGEETKNGIEKALKN